MTIYFSNAHGTPLKSCKLYYQPRLSTSLPHTHTRVASWQGSRTKRAQAGWQEEPLYLLQPCMLLFHLQWGYTRDEFACCLQNFSIATLLLSLYCHLKTVMAYGMYWTHKSSSYSPNAVKLVGGSVLKQTALAAPNYWQDAVYKPTEYLGN